MHRLCRYAKKLVCFWRGQKEMPGASRLCYQTLKPCAGGELGSFECCTEHLQSVYWTCLFGSWWRTSCGHWKIIPLPCQTCTGHDMWGRFVLAKRVSPSSVKRSPAALSRESLPNASHTHVCLLPRTLFLRQLWAYPRSVLASRIGPLRPLSLSKIQYQSCFSSRGSSWVQPDLPATRPNRNSSQRSHVVVNFLRTRCFLHHAK